MTSVFPDVFPGGNHRIIIAANLWIWDTVDKQLIMLYEKKKHICIFFTFLTQMHDNWKYHKPKVASYWLVKLDSTKQRKVSCDLISCFLFPPCWTSDLLLIFMFFFSPFWPGSVNTEPSLCVIVALILTTALSPISVFFISCQLMTKGPDKWWTVSTSWSHVLNPVWVKVFFYVWYI